MALKWDLTKIEDNKTLCWVGDDDGNVTMNPVTEALIWRTLMIGIGEITKANWQEFWTRTEMLHLAFGLDSATPDDVKAHIGLRTNVFPGMTKQKFGYHVARVLRDRTTEKLQAAE